MYGKIFDSIYDSTLADDWRALITFQQLIVLCDADGTIDMTPHAIARRTSIPIEYIEAGLKILEAPDPYSRTPDQDGRRIQRLDDHRPWGWSIVNHAHYKGLQDAETVREQNRLRKRSQRDREKQQQENSHADSVTFCDKRDSHAKSRHTDTDTYTDKNKGRFRAPSVQEVQVYLDERGITSFAADTFVNHYEANGWMRGKTKIKDWKACVRYWESQRKSSQPEDEFRGAV